MGVRWIVGVVEAVMLVVEMYVLTIVLVVYGDGGKGLWG